MDLARQIDIYCERVGAAFWAEPLNALTNLAFVAAGIAALWLQGRTGGAGPRRELTAGALMAAGLIAGFAHTIGLLWALGAGPLYTPLVLPAYAVSMLFVGAGLCAMPRLMADPAPDWAVAWLAGNAVVVGIGSFLFHTYATPWAGFADTGPIMLFIFGYFAVAMLRFGGLGRGAAAAATLGFLAASVLLSRGISSGLGPYAGPSAGYYPALVGLLAVGLWLDIGRGHAAGGQLIRAAGLFAASLGFRSVDGPLCDWLPIGTHWLWHLCNGLLFWLLLRAVVRHGPVPLRQAAAAALRAAA
ncbi:ceramidase domain-containing protein [Paralimibaculum aggregatum]|uniref:Ceramidase domain-containing protein n=1 Tax=Paralimibaculum aggregatum TaxID=3036245 RepID=A0ABQ6LQV1_9RHOB|nr:hypothetical protein [Limibaculum sp. NKW23]GMG83256.1 ceramidase domain-containing protein [Limibaculum sp. NKW23]